MIKKYIKPETLVVSINLSNLILVESVQLNNFDNGSGGSKDEADSDDEYSRSDENNRSNVWDNIW